MDQVDSWEGTYERSGGTRVQFSWSLVPLKSAALQWLALQSSFYYLIVLERALSPSSSSWSIEFLNFLHKSSSSRSNLRTSPTQNLQQKTLQLFVAHFLFKHWIASNDFIVWADHTISLFGELLIWAPFSSHPLAANLRWLWSWEATIWWVSECFWGCQRTRRVSWWKKCQAHSSAARQLQGSMNRALQLSCNLMLTAPQQATTGCRNENDELVKLTRADEEVGLAAANSRHSSLKKNVPSSTIVACSLSKLCSSSPGCSRQKTAVGSKIGWRRCASPSPGIGMTGRSCQQARCNTTSRSTCLVTDWPSSKVRLQAATERGTESCSNPRRYNLLQAELHLGLEPPRRTWRSWRRCVPVPSPSSADDAPIHTGASLWGCWCRQEIHRENKNARRCRSFRFFSSSAAI